MIIFFDIGQKGAVSFFEKKKFIKTINFALDKKKSKDIKTKILLFQNFLKKEFANLKNVNDVGCYRPLGTNRKTIMNLAMMTAILIVFFDKANFHLINEWNAWKTITKQQTIPVRKIKKMITIEWAKNQFKLDEINDDGADAILGGFFLSQRINQSI